MQRESTHMFAWYAQLPADPHCVLNRLWKAIKVDAEQMRLEFICHTAKIVTKVTSPAVAKTSVLNRMFWFEEEEARAVRPVGVDDTESRLGLKSGDCGLH